MNPWRALSCFSLMLPCCGSCLSCPRCRNRGARTRNRCRNPAAAIGRPSQARPLPPDGRPRGFARPTPPRPRTRGPADATRWSIRVAGLCIPDGKLCTGGIAVPNETTSVIGPVRQVDAMSAELGDYLLIVGRKRASLLVLTAVAWRGFCGKSRQAHGIHFTSSLVRATEVRMATHRSFVPSSNFVTHRPGD